MLTHWCSQRPKQILTQTHQGGNRIPPDAQPAGLPQQPQHNSYRTYWWKKKLRCILHMCVSEQPSLKCKQIQEPSFVGLLVMSCWCKIRWSFCKMINLSFCGDFLETDELHHLNGIIYLSIGVSINKYGADIIVSNDEHFVNHLSHGGCCETDRLCSRTI